MADTLIGSPEQKNKADNFQLIQQIPGYSKNLGAEESDDMAGGDKEQLVSQADTLAALELSNEVVAEYRINQQIYIITIQKKLTDFMRMPNN
ncbi:hypothetical protein PR048_019729 [Dryococelus australis]|uniref:Uncharacterized protein n=1 Tax=Dryococelus australis TaxID=614101 RepID=A0ABQ9H4A2_9NEOP|nr:hypothetical protein PR048_019729 [Dryococelus australis]